MSLADTIWFCLALIGMVAFGAKLSVDGEPVDIMALIALSIYVGWMGRLL